MTSQNHTGCSSPEPRRTYWTSFQHLADSPEIAAAVEKEFANYDPADLVQVSRRRFLKYAAASMALAGIGLSGCRRWPEKVVAPYAHKPKERIEGVPDYYASSWELAGVGTGLLVLSYDGRPIKIEGNPQHPGSVTRSGEWGAADAMAQAQTLSLYDPERSRAVVHHAAGTGPERIETFRDQVIPVLRQTPPGRLAILSEATASPTMQRLREQLEQQGVQWCTWEPLGLSELAEATQAATGQRLRPVYRLDQARTIVSIDDDYLGMHPAHIRYAADWSVGRASVDADQPQMSHCHTVECRYSLTGASSDHRLPARPSRLPLLVAALAAEMGLGEGGQAQLEPKEQEFIRRAAGDLRAAGANGLLAWGPHLPAGLQVMCMQINERLGSVGTTLNYIQDPIPPAGTIQQLAQRMEAGEIQSLIILGGNPVYNAPAELEFARRLANVQMSVHLSLYDDETSARCTYHVPRAHFLEAWGDTRGWDGTVAPIQPLILPLYNGLSSIELIALLLGLPQTDGYSLVRETITGLTQQQGQGQAGQQPAQGGGQPEGMADADRPFRRALHEGVVAETAHAPVQASIRAGRDLPMTPARLGEGDFEVVFSGDSRLFDGRFANNGWLQETPETMTKLTWDNAALMNIADANELGVRTMDVINLTVGGRTLGMAVYVMPGQPRGVIGLPLGFGRTRAGSIGTFLDGEGGGFDTYRLRFSNGLWFAAGAAAVRQGQRYLLAMTQNHHLIDEVGYSGRRARVGGKGETASIIRETTFAEHVADHERTREGAEYGAYYPAHKGQHGAISLQIFKPPHSFASPHAWGMTIDMTTCIGCSACVVACQAENNIPIVGKTQVLNNREMHWLRIDRYFKSEGRDYREQTHDPNPDVVMQPMMCVHCENAPCEQVCPVAATLHDTEGLNVMVYNRCIGTRYCSNNCPYKVRRFNYVDYHVKNPRGSMLGAVHLGMPDSQQANVDAIRRMVYNPEVTVRMRGIMEKCTYCTQRIKLKTIWRGNRGETIQDGDIRTACQMACPTESIIFGNLLDESARVTQQQHLRRAYGVLEDLNTRPRTKYLARLRNRDAKVLPQGATDAGH